MGSRTLFIPIGGMDETNYYTKGEINLMIADFITNTVDDLVNYYTKSETYTQTEVNTLIGNIETIHFEFAASTSAVTDPQSNVIYLIGPTGSGSDKYEEYVYSNNTWTKIGDTSIDLSDYVTTSDLQTALNDYVTTTSLQTALADYTPSARLSTVATSGAYSDLTGTPTLATVATSGAYSDLSGTPTLATVATTGDYTDLANTPNLAAVATTGAYSDLTGAPTLATVATTGSYNDLTDKPSIPTVGTGIVTLTSNGDTIGKFGLNDTDDKTIEIPAGGGGNAWYGSQAQFDALGTSADPNTDYYINEINYSEINGTPDLTGFATKTEMQTADTELTYSIAGKADPIVFLGTGGLSTIGTPLEGVTYAVEGETVALTFTLDGIGTVTYNFVID